MYDGEELEDEVAGGSEGDDEDFFNEADEVNDNEADKVNDNEADKVNNNEADKVNNNEADKVNDNDGVAFDNDHDLHGLNNPFSEARYPTGDDIPNTDRPTIPNDNPGAVSSNI